MNYGTKVPQKLHQKWAYKKCPKSFKNPKGGGGVWTCLENTQIKAAYFYGFPNLDILVGVKDALMMKGLPLIVPLFSFPTQIEKEARVLFSVRDVD